MTRGMGLGIWHSCRKLHNFYLNGYEFREHGIACALRWGVALVGVFSAGLCSPRRGKIIFQVLEVHREMKQVQEIS